MKKLMIMAAIVCSAAFANAAAVGWTNAGLGKYAGDAYYMFVIGANGVTDMATVTSVLDNGGDFSKYVFGGGKVATNGSANQSNSVAGAPTLGEGTWTAFMVLFDSSAPKSGEAKYATISGPAGFTKEIGASTANITFAGNNVSGFVSDFKSYGAVPEPTSGLLLLLGVAGLALKRRRA